MREGLTVATPDDSFQLEAISGRVTSWDIPSRAFLLLLVIRGNSNPTKVM